MAIGQKLVDPFREFKVSVRYSWQESYHAALLESDWTKMVELVQAAESEIHKRRLELSKDHNGTQEEREAVVNALNGLRVLRIRCGCLAGAAKSRLYRAEMKHVVVRWNPATREHFCLHCGQTTDAINIEDAQVRLEQYDCLIPSVDTVAPPPGTETIRLMRKFKK